MKSGTKNPLNLLINEVNVKNVFWPETNEFLEFRSTVSNPSMPKPLAGYSLYVIYGYLNKNLDDKIEADGAYIDLYANLSGIEMEPDINFFTIGGLDINEKDISIEDERVIFPKKFSNDPNKLTDVFPNQPRHADNPIGIILVFDEKHNPPLNLLVLKEKKLLITEDMIQYLKSHAVDMLVYGTSTGTDRCLVFEKIHPEWAAFEILYILRDIDIFSKLKEYSINKCSSVIKGFRPDIFKNGNPSPNEPNDCTGVKFILEDKLNFLREEGVPPEDTSEDEYREVCRENVPLDESCSPLSVSRAEYHAVNGMTMENVMESEMAKHKSSPCSLLSQDHNSVDNMAGNVRAKVKSNFQRRKRHFDQLAPEEPWEIRTDFFDPEWKKIIDEHQSHLMPLKSLQRTEVQRWFEYLPNRDDLSKSRYRCRVCHKGFYGSEMKFPKRIEPVLASPEGVLKDTYKANSDLISAHAKRSVVHQQIINNLQKERLNDAGEFMAKAAKKADSGKFEVTAKMFRVVFTEVMLNIPLSNHKEIVNLMDICGAEMGYHHYEETSANRMKGVISNSMHQKMIKFLESTSTPISIILDGSTDKGLNHYLVVLIQAIEDHKPIVYFYRLILIGDETAAGLLESLIHAFEEDGITEVMKARLFSFASDGANVMSGRLNGLGKILGDYVGRDLVKIHCMAHKIHLAIRRAFKDINYIFHVESALNQMYTFYYSHSHKRLNHLREFAQGVPLLQLNYIFEVRWITSELSSVRRVIKNYEFLQGDLLQITEGTEFDQKSKRTAQGILRSLQDKNFYEIICFLGDVLTVLSKFSLEMQKRDGILIDQVKNLKKMKDDILNLRHNDGDFITQALSKKLICGTIRCKSLKEFEDASVTKYDNSDNPGFSFEFHKQSRHSVYKKVTQVREELLNKLIKEIDRYFPIDSIEAFQIFNPINFPSFDELAQYGKKEIPILANLYDSGNSDNIFQEFQDFLIKSYQDGEYCTYEASSTTAFWQHALSSQDIKIGESLSGLILKILSTPISSADAERAFSILFHIRSTRRSRLSPLNLEDLLRIRMNAPKDIYKFPAEEYAKIWAKNHYLTDADGGLKRKRKGTISGGPNGDDDIPKEYLDDSNLF